MCKSKVDGGQRCAAHTRPKFLAVSFDSPEWDGVAAEYASTNEGHQVVRLLAHMARQEGRFADEARMNHALECGENLKSVNAAIAASSRQPVAASSRLPLNENETFDTYRRHCQARMEEEYPDVDGAAVADVVIANAYIDFWEEIQDGAKHGRRYPPQVLEDLEPHNRRYLETHYPDACRVKPAPEPVAGLPETLRSHRGHAFFPTTNLPPLGSTEGDGKPYDKQFREHYFTSSSDWYVCEYDPQTGEAFGYAQLGGDEMNAEYGYFNLVEMESLHLPPRHHGYGAAPVIVERDTHFRSGTRAFEVVHKLRAQKERDITSG